jgi:hypothetical protein
MAARGQRGGDGSPADTIGVMSETEGRATSPTPLPAGGPLYKGEPLDAGRGPGLGCFWLQVGILAVLLVLTPLSVVWGAPPLLSAALLIITLVLLLFAGQTVIFLLRLVAADRRSRRRPLSADARRTVGQLEDEAASDAIPPRSAAADDPGDG